MRSKHDNANHICACKDARAPSPSEAHRVHIHPPYHTAFQLLNYRRFLPFFPFFFFFFPLFPLRPPPLLRAAAAAAAVASAARTALASSAASLHFIGLALGRSVRRFSISLFQYRNRCSLHRSHARITRSPFIIISCCAYLLRNHSFIMLQAALQERFRFRRSGILNIASDDLSIDEAASK